MFGWLKGKAQDRRTGQQLYEHIVAQARAPAFYEAHGVPDSMDGRLEMVMLHTVVVLDRLRTEGAAGQRLGQRLMERLVADMDDALRRIGLGDDSVAVRIKRLGGALRERARDYGQSLGAPGSIPVAIGEGSVQASAGSVTPSSLESKLLEHVYRPADAVASAEASPRARDLAAYVRRARDRLAATPSSEVLAGHIVFPAAELPPIEQEAAT